MDRDTFSHIRLWCPRPFGTYSQNRPRATGAGGGGGGGGGGTGGGAPSPCKTDAAGGRGAPATEGQDDDDEEDEDEDDACSENTPPAGLEPASSSSAPPSAPPPPATAVTAPGEDGRVLLDTWYVIKPGNTKEKIAFFVAHQCSGAGLPRPSAMKVKGNWVTGCSKAKRRRRCSSYDPPATARAQDATVAVDDHPPAPSPPPPPPEEVSESDLLSVAEMVALVEQRTAMALQGMVMTSSSSADDEPGGHATAAVSGDPTTPMVFLSEGPPPPTPPPPPPAPRPPLLLLPPSTEEQQEEEESRRVAHAVARFESQNPEEKKPPGSDSSPSSSSSSREPGASPNHGRGGGGSGEVRIAFRVSSLDPRSQSEPAGRPRCMFMSCGGGGAGGGGARAKEKITCDLYQLVSPSSRDPSLLLGPPKPDDSDRTACGGGGGGSDPALELRPPGVGDKKGGPLAAGGRGERLTGFHVEVVVTGAVDQCVFYGKDSTENVQEETVCFAMPGVAGGDPSEDPPPGQLFFLQAGGEEEEDEEEGGRSGADDGMMCPLDCANGPAPEAADSPLGGVGGGGVGTAMAEDRPDPSPLCRLYRHVSHDFLEIRFQIQRLLEPRQYMLLLPHHIALNIFAWLPTRSLAALKCTCRDFRDLIELYGVRATDSRWNRDPLYRDDPCKQCKRRYERGDVSLCRWHPKPYHHDLPYGRSYWMCCRRADKDTPGCRVGLHDNNWVQQCELPPALQPRPKRQDGR